VSSVGAFRAHIRAIAEWRKNHFVDPGLPSAVLPLGWPGQAVGKGCLQLRERMGRASLGHVRKSELLKCVDPEALACLKRTATPEDYDPYRPIFFQGDPADALFPGQNGNVNVTQETEAGPVAIAHRRPGDAFGERLGACRRLEAGARLEPLINETGS